jgi:lipid-A-disaccharide synthase
VRIGVVAGEVSGDILGARVLAALRQHYSDIVFEGVGGPLMQAQGLHSLYPLERLSVMGLVEPLQRLPELVRMRRALYRHFRANPPDLLLGIDAPDFNLALERKLRRLDISTAHLVSPSVWAWRRGRIHKIKRSVDLMLCLFPFETQIYRQHRVPVQFVGHPLADEIAVPLDQAAARAALGLPEAGKLLAILPGSREREVALLAPDFLRAARLLCAGDSRLGIIVPAATDALHRQLTHLLAAYPELPVTLVKGQSRQVMAAADAVLLASGTASLEAALLRRPMVVAYRMGGLSWALLSRLLKTPFVALPNVLAGRALVPELLQHEASPEALAAAMLPLLDGGVAVRLQLQGFADIHRQLRGDYAQSAAAALVKLISDKPGGSSGRSVPA